MTNNIENNNPLLHPGQCLPYSMRHAVDSLLYGAMNYPIILASTIILASGTNYFLSSPWINELLNSTSTTSRFDIGYWVLELVSSVSIVGLLYWRRREDSRLVGDYSILGIGYRCQSKPATTKSQSRFGFVCWQILLAVSIASSVVMFDVSVFPEHTRKQIFLHQQQQQNSENNNINPYQYSQQMEAITIMSFLRPMFSIVYSLGWILLLGFWTDPFFEDARLVKPASLKNNNKVKDSDDSSDEENSKRSTKRSSNHGDSTEYQKRFGQYLD
jgi:hypothetical protein